MKKGLMPMPLDVLVETKDGKTELYHIPLDLMRNHKSPDIKHDKYIVSEDWPWINPTYTLEMKCKEDKIKMIVIDPSYRMVDMNRADNIWHNNE
jgi:hypothetical protein